MIQTIKDNRRYNLDKEYTKDYCNRFLEYAQVRNIKTIEEDLGEIINRIDDGWKELNTRLKSVGRNVSQQKDILKIRLNLVREFLEAVYAYFDANKIEVSSDKAKNVQKIQLIGFLRLINPNVL